MERAASPRASRISSVAFDDLDDLDDLIAVPALAGSAAELNQWLRLNAETPSLQSQWHVQEFTKWVLED